MALSSGEADFGALGLPPHPVRDADLEELKAIDIAIANFTNIGQQPTPHLRMLKEQIDAKLYRERGIAPEVDDKFSRERERAAAAAEFEHKAEVPLVETVVPRKPGRPRKPVDDSPAGS